jgi:hypothetical protein
MNLLPFFTSTINVYISSRSNAEENFDLNTTNISLKKLLELKGIIAQAI